MTEQTQPTDAELLPCPFCGTQPDECDIGQFVVECPSCAIVGPASDNSNAAKRAWNTRWGTPAGAGEPVAWEIAGWINAGELLALKQGATYAHVYSSKQTGASQPIFTTPQPTQAQAGAVPLTDEQIEEIAKQFITRVGSHWEHDDAIPDNGRIEDFVRAIEAAHGIKGADHD